MKLSKQLKVSITNSIIKQAKKNKSVAQFYLTNYILLHNESYIYYLKHIQYQLYDADGLYRLLTSSDLITFYSFIENSLLKEKDSYEEFKDKKKQTLLYHLRINALYFIVQRLKHSFSKDNILYLDFNKLTFDSSDICIELFLLFIKKNTTIEEVDLTKSVICEKTLLDILDAVEQRESFFTLNLNEVEISQKVLVAINQILKKDPKKQIMTNKKYTGKSKSVLTYSQIKNKKYKQKYNKPGNIIRFEDNNERNEN